MAPRLIARDHHPEVQEHLPLLLGGRFSSNLLLRYPAPFLGVIASGLGTTVGVMGLALSAGEFAGLGAPAVGRAADRRGPRLAMGVGLGLCTVGALGAAAAPVVIVFALAMVVIQLSKVSFDAAVTSWVADRVPFARRSEVTGIIETSWAMALLVGIPVLALVVDRWGWRTGYVAIAVLCGAGAVFAWRRIPDETPAAVGDVAVADAGVVSSGTPSSGTVSPGTLSPGTLSPGASVGPAPGSPAAWWRLPRRSLAALAAVALLMGAIQLVVVVEGVWFEDAFGFSTAGIGGGILVIGVAELVGSLSSARLTDRVGKRRSMVAGALVMGPCMACLGLVGSNAVIGIAVLAVGTMGFEYALVSAFPLVAELDVMARGTMFTLMLAAGTVMRGVSDALGGVLFDLGGITAVGLTSAGMVAAVLLVLVVGVREPERV